MSTDKYNPEVVEVFSRAIERVKPTIPGKLLEILEQVDCFGYLWKDQSGICPEEECCLRRYCEVTYDVAEKISNVEDVKVRPLPVKTVILTKPEPVIVNKERKKPQENDKFYQRGYTAIGRPVDDLLRRFVHNVGYPKVLPKFWSFKNMRKGKYPGKVHIAVTASYHTLFINDFFVCRFWGNAAKFALLDVVERVAEYLDDAGFELLPIPTKGGAKFKPAFARVKLLTVEEVDKVVDCISKHYNVNFEKNRFLGVI